jgi:hypothetical protein
MMQFRRVFVPHPNFRFGTDHLKKLGDEIVYVCESPMFDDMLGPEHTAKFEARIRKELRDFDPVEDIVADYGDAMIFAMMVFHLAEFHYEINVARYSTKKEMYVVRQISSDNFFQKDDEQ